MTKTATVITAALVDEFAQVRDQLKALTAREKYLKRGVPRARCRYLQGPPSPNRDRVHLREAHRHDRRSCEAWCRVVRGECARDREDRNSPNGNRKMNHEDRDRRDADLIQDALLGRKESNWADRALDIASWVLSVLLLAMIVIAPIIWGWI